MTVIQPVRPALTATLMTNGQFGFWVNGDEGPDYTIQFSTNLVSWSLLATVDSPLLPFMWGDTNAIKFDSRVLQDFIGAIKCSSFSMHSINMRKHIALVWLAVVYAAICRHADAASGILENSLVEGKSRAAMTIKEDGPQRTYELTTTAELRDPDPPDKSVVIHEFPGCARIRTGSVFFDGLYALGVQEAMQDSVTQIKDGAYNHGDPIKLEAFQTGELWTYVWTRDLSYSTYLALAQFDPQRALNSLLFKTSVTKPSVTGGFTNQIVQDTGSGGSYPVSSDRVVWALGASQLLKFLSATEQQEVLKQVYPILHDTLEQDRQLIYDPEDGLYRGEQSFLDWREQTYPGWTKTNVLAIAMSKALSVNAADYFALVTASEYAGKLGRHEDQVRYATWARQLKAAINSRFFDAEAGLYSAYLLTDEAHGIRVHRYDLLGESLAILTGVADQSQAESILRRYPVGPYGPPVVWPEETHRSHLPQPGDLAFCHRLLDRGGAKGGRRDGD